MNEFVSLFTGEYGGTFAMAFMGGVAVGYSFAQKTVITEAKRRILKLEKRVEDLTDLRIGKTDDGS